MSNHRRRYQLNLEGLEERMALSAAASAAAPTALAAQAASASQNTVATLQAFTQAYLSTFGQPNYNPAFDFNRNGFIGQDDGRHLLRSLPPLTRKIPLNLTLVVAPEDRPRAFKSINSGGASVSKETTVLGHTTPGALIFTGTGTLDLKLRGPAAVANAKGNFSLNVTLENGINQLDVQAVDHFGQQNLRAFPIYWTGFSHFQNTHPQKT